MNAQANQAKSSTRANIDESGDDDMFSISVWMAKFIVSSVRPSLTASKAFYVLFKKDPLFTMDTVCEEYLMHDSIIFKGNLRRCNLGICLVDGSIVYAKLVGTAILSLNIGGKFCTTQFKDFYLCEELESNLIFVGALVSKGLSVEIEPKEGMRFIHKKINTIALEARQLG